MRFGRLIRRNLLFFWRTNLAVIAGVATAVAVLAGALLVGDSVRESLRDLVLERLGNVDYLVSADRFFREELATNLAAHKESANSIASTCPIILLQGIAIHEKSGRRSQNVNIYGVDETYWRFQARDGTTAPQGREALLGETLARELSAQPEDTILVRFAKQEGIPKESAFGRREDTGRTVRLVCREVLSREKLGNFSLRPNPGSVFSMFVPLGRIQQDLQKEGKINAILISIRQSGEQDKSLRRGLRESFTLQDLGLKLRLLEQRRVAYLESERILLETPFTEAARVAASQSGLLVSEIYTYLANSIRFADRATPYSVITAADLNQGSLRSVVSSASSVGGTQPNKTGDPIWLNEWTQSDLGVSIGHPVAIDYYLWQEQGRLITKTAQFHLAGVVSLEGDAADPNLAPDFPGITEARSVSDWDPPFPLDLKRIRPKDEEYWDRYRTTPKAFIPLVKGQELWQTRFGKLTAVRMTPQPGKDLRETLRSFETSLRARLDPLQSGFTIDAVKARGLEASRGPTDFGEYFLYFSFFLIGAAMLLGALFFRLGVEQRIQEIGILLATGFAASTIRKVFLLEGALLSVLGSAFGLAGATIYAWFLLFGLRTWWSGAIGTQNLPLHLVWMPFAWGGVIGVLVALLSVILTLRGLQQSSPRAMLAGLLETPPAQTQQMRLLRLTGTASLLSGLVLIVAASLAVVKDVVAFFGAGSLLLVALLCTVALRFRRRSVRLLAGRGKAPVLRLGARNVSYRPGRSLLCVALIASATFLIVSLEAFRHDLKEAPKDKASGSGGFLLFGESVLPWVHDLNSAEGLEALGLFPQETSSLRGARMSAFRLKPGDDTSCLNLYTPQEPRILGASKEFVRSGRFSFQDSVARTKEEEDNPWLLLESALPSGAIPAIGDASTIRYILHSSLGKELVIRRSGGESVRLLFVAALKDSIFQGELLISEANFVKIFPEQEGYRFLLVDAPQERSVAITKVLEGGLADIGMDVSETRERLAAFHRVENTYLSTFQSLGGLGLVLGTVGLATVLMRNVIERRHELALLRAVGFRRNDLASMVLAENALLMLYGLAVGTSCALVAIAPALRSRAGEIPFMTLSAMLGAVLIVGLGASLLAGVAAFRAPLLSALRSE